jgi:hypothetical protein
LLGGLHYGDAGPDSNTSSLSLVLVGNPPSVPVFGRSPWGETTQMLLTCDEPKPGRRGGT